MFAHEGEPGDEATTPPDLQTYMYMLCATGNSRKPFQVVIGLKVFPKSLHVIY